MFEESNQPSKNTEINNHDDVKMSNSVVNHRNSPAKKKMSYADVANSTSSSSRSSSSSSSRIAINAFNPSEDFLAQLEFLLGHEMKFRGSAQPHFRLVLELPAYGACDLPVPRYRRSTRGLELPTGSPHLH